MTKNIQKCCTTLFFKIQPKCTQKYKHTRMCKIWGPQKKYINVLSLFLPLHNIFLKYKILDKIKLFLHFYICILSLIVCWFQNVSFILVVPSKLSWGSTFAFVLPQNYLIRIILGQEKSSSNFCLFCLFGKGKITWKKVLLVPFTGL